MDIPCLGRPFQLGMLYDSRTDQIIPGVKLWDEQLLRDEKYLNVRPYVQSSYDIISEDSISDKMFHLDVEAGIKASFLGDLIKVSGSAKFLQDKKSSKHQSRISLQYKYTVRFEELTMDQMAKVKFSQPIDNDVATHVVTGVEYGSEVVFVFDREVSQNESYIKVNGSMQATIKKLSSVADVEGHASLDLNDDEKENVDKFHCKFYGDIQLKQNPTTFEEAVETYKNLPSLMKEDEQGIPATVPKRVWLYPLSLLESKAARLEREISNDLINQAEGLMQCLDELNMRTNDLMKTEVCEIFAGIHQQLSKFRGIVAKYSDDRKIDLATLLPQIRRGEKEKERELFKVFTDSSNELQRLTPWLERKEEEVHVLTTYLDSMKDIQRASSPGDVSVAINNVEYKYVLCFAIKDSGLDNPDLSTEDSDDPWYRKPNLISDMRRKAKQFTAFAHANAKKEDLLCLIANQNDNISDGKYAAITLYEDGKPTGFELPSEPGKPVASNVTLDSIQLEWAKPQYGAENVAYYTISYRQHTEHSDVTGSWMTQKTEGVQETATVTGLARSTAYDFKINAACDVGSGPASEINDSIETEPKIVQIVPRERVKGIDFCGGESYQYIVRSDLGHYMKTYHVRDDDYLTMHNLHSDCSWGDHYLSTSDYDYIIKGDSCRCVVGLDKDKNATMFTLHKNNTGGRFYMATDSKSFYIIFHDHSLKHVADLSKESSDDTTQPLDPKCKGGLYYWATSGYFYFLKPGDKWGLKYHRTRDLTNDKEGIDYTVHPTVAKFLPHERDI